MRSGGLMRGILANGFTTVRDNGGATAVHAQATEEFIVLDLRVFQREGDLRRPEDMVAMEKPG
ncbi:hypothetical protein PMAA_077270 [Talaromyces marneffei ATCC 18224]|uniref:Uncharacterized protein n=1 Tax=Talaromyces marneffei (strain ATCC 18224 / CBS 334.59 / QM 7333) TaxID=441960 RepID=B6QCY3_TALMQ|nr:hypothetical protein PMAA_077270 [Talaromyces marneffei ATCC 18224]